MPLTYARIDSIARRLSGRISVVESLDANVLGITKTQIGTDLINLVGEGIEEMMNMYLGMVYFLPLQKQHPFLSSIAEKLICAEVYLTYFPTQGESSDNADSYTSVLRTQALNEFQTLFDGLGIFVPGASNQSLSIQNDESKEQLLVKAVFLPGEKVKKYIGYDYDEDGMPDTELFITNTNTDPSFYTAENFTQLSEGEDAVINGVRVRPKRYNRNRFDIVDFW